MSYRVAVALGSNLGPRLQLLRGAVAALSRLGRLEAVSSLYETAPVGGPDQGPYLNAVVVLTTPRDPRRLLRALLSIESDAGRQRQGRWGPRRLDLDLISGVDRAGNWLEIEGGGLEVPHPRAHQRRFVLEPLVEVWPEARVGGGVSARQALPSVGDQQVERLGPDWVDRRTGTARALVAAQAAMFAGYGLGIALDGRVPRRLDLATSVAVVGVGTGAALAVWGARVLGPAMSPYPEPRPATELVARGPYRFVRHPIYAGLVLAAAGTAMAARSPRALAAAAGIGAFFSKKARYEEARLRLAVPGYADYQRRVRGRLLPRTKAPT